MSSFPHFGNKKPWVLDDDPKNYILISDPVLVAIKLFYPLNLLVDTTEFKRLLELKQLGLAYMVFPNATHTRFVHSLEVYYLALLHVQAIASRDKLREPKETESITLTDMLCVCIAALVHDLGHGPLSHTWDEFMKKLNLPWRHEGQSRKIFEHLLENNPDVKNVLDEYLTERDYIFIKEIIDPPKEFITDGIWQLEGRGKDKAQLYGIVSNVHDSIDVDKFAYLILDSKMTNVGIPFNLFSLAKIRTHVKTNTCPYMEFPRLGYSDDAIDDLKAVMDSRQILHKQVYNDETKIAFEIKVLDALDAAKNHLFFRGSNNTMTSLHDIILNNDITGYLQLKDSILDRIKDSWEQGLESAREILLKIDKRQRLYNVGEATISDREFLSLTQEEQERKVTAYMRNVVAKRSINTDFIVAVRPVHRGMGMDVDPLSKVLIYNKNDILDEKVCLIPPSSNKIIDNPGDVLAYVYIPSEMSNEENDKVYEVFKKWCELYKAQPLPKKRKISERSILQRANDYARNLARDLAN